MRILRTAIMAIGLMGLAAACGGSKKEAEEPTPAADPAAESPCAAPTEESPCAAPAEGTEGDMAGEGAEGGEER